MPAECPPASTDAALRALQTQHADLLARLSVLYSVLVHCSQEQEKLGSESFQSKALWGLCHCCVFLFGDTSSGTGTGDTSKRSSPGRTTRLRPEWSFTLPRCSRWRPPGRDLAPEPASRPRASRPRGAPSLPCAGALAMPGGHHARDRGQRVGPTWNLGTSQPRAGRGDRDITRERSGHRAGGRQSRERFGPGGRPFGGGKGHVCPPCNESTLGSLGCSEGPP